MLKPSEVPLFVGLPCPLEREVHGGLRGHSCNGVMITIHLAAGGHMLPHSSLCDEFTGDDKDGKRWCSLCQGIDDTCVYCSYLNTSDLEVLGDTAWTVQWAELKLMEGDSLNSTTVWAYLSYGENAEQLQKRYCENWGNTKIYVASAAEDSW